MSFKVTDWPRHNCVPDLPPVEDFSRGTIIKCEQPWLRGGQMKPCGRQWILTRGGWFQSGDLEWTEVDGGW